MLRRTQRLSREICGGSVQTCGGRYCFCARRVTPSIYKICGLSATIGCRGTPAWFSSGVIVSESLFDFIGDFTFETLGENSGIALGATPRALLHALLEADGCSGKIEFLAKLVFEKTLVTEVQAANLIRKQHEGGRRDGGLREVINFHLAAGWRCAAVEIDGGKPAIQLACGDAALARGHDFVDQRKKAAGALARERGEKNDGRIIEKLQFFADQFFVIRHELHGIDSAFFRLRFMSGGGATLRRFEGEVPLVDDDDKRAAGLLRVAGNGGVM